MYASVTNMCTLVVVKQLEYLTFMRRRRVIQLIS